MIEPCGEGVLTWGISSSFCMSTDSWPAILLISRTCQYQNQVPTAKSHAFMLPTIVPMIQTAMHARFRAAQATFFLREDLPKHLGPKKNSTLVELVSVKVMNRSTFNSLTLEIARCRDTRRNLDDGLCVYCETCVLATAVKVPV